MNERIKDLYKQSANQDYFPIDSEEVYMSAKDLKKFAELIVKECAGIAKKEQAFNAQYTDANMHPQVNIDQCILMGFGL
jgi:hypothetical protein